MLYLSKIKEYFRFNYKKKLKLLFLFMLLFVVNAYSQEGNIFLGKWNAIIKGTPNGNLKMSLEIQLCNNRIIGYVTTNSEESIKISKVKFKENKAIVHFWHEWYIVVLEMTMTDSNQCKCVLADQFYGYAVRVY